MTSLIVKATWQTGACTLGHPGATPGPIRDAGANYRITEIPDEVTPAEVVRLFEGTTFRGEQYEWTFSDLGLGRILGTTPPTPGDLTHG